MSAKQESKLVNVTINGRTLEVEAGITVLKACEFAGIEIPRFCYHDRLSIAGNCRMCLVEIKGGPPKPSISCATMVADAMVIRTDSEMVKKAREGVLEFLLINHPLDCPICDQGGECDLQDETMCYGLGNNRFSEQKRAVPTKYMGPLVKTHMNRCIHCTRCIRFLSDVAGTEELGTLSRGEDMEVTNAIAKSLTSELSGNIIDLCPVGALTSRPYAFKARSWEMRHCETIDVMDAVGSAIRVDYKDQSVMRVLPRLNEAVNEEWISDKTRFSYDGLGLQRLDVPYVRRDERLEQATWKEAFDAISQKMKYTSGNRMAAIAGDLVDCESMTVLKELMESLGCYNIDCRQDQAMFNADNPCFYLFNTTIAGIEKSDLCLLVGVNPRIDAPLINARIRKNYLKGGFEVANIGPQNLNLNYECDHLGDSIKILDAIERGEHHFANKIRSAKNPMLIVGQDIMIRQDADAILCSLCKIAESCGFVKEGWNGFNVLHKKASRVGGLELKFLPQQDKGGKNITEILNNTQNGEISIVYLLGADEINMEQLGDAFVIYQGHHGDAGAHRADVILPGCAYTEKMGTYINTEGRVQRAQRAVFPPGQAKDDWQIICELSRYIGQNVFYENIEQIQKQMSKISHRFNNLDEIRHASWMAFESDKSFTNLPITLNNVDFYMTDSISRASKTMARCQSMIARNTEEVEQ